jgi:hypothetical protein
MISPTDAAAFLPPTFQIITGLSFALLIAARRADGTGTP